MNLNGPLAGGVSWESDPWATVWAPQTHRYAFLHPTKGGLWVKGKQIISHKTLRCLLKNPFFLHHYTLPPLCLALFFKIVIIVSITCWLKPHFKDNKSDGVKAPVWTAQPMTGVPQRHKARQCCRNTQASFLLPFPLCSFSCGGQTPYLTSSLPFFLTKALHYYVYWFVYSLIKRQEAVALMLHV